MAVLLQIKDAQKSYGDQDLLDNASVTITDNTKVGFVGRNGAGKSTLLRVIMGDEDLDSGEVIFHPSLRIGYLRQHNPFEPGETAMEFLLRDSGAPEWKCGDVAGDFEIKGDYLFGPVSELSGGWQTRVKLAALLLHEPNLLLLDEPTNFLDLRTQILLENFLKRFSEACLIVSHDRDFLRATCDSTLELSRGKLQMFPNKIDRYLEFVEERKEHDERVNAAVVAKQKQLQKFIDKNRANANTAAQARNKAKQLDRLQTIEITGAEPTAYIRAPKVEPRHGPAVRCIDLSIGYPDHTVAERINVEIEHGDRAAVMGDNGQGKTTFLRTIVDSLEPVSGEVKWGYGCNIGVYAQHVYSTLPEDQTILDFLEYNSTPDVTTQDCLNLCGALLFRGSHVKKKIGVLSGGERARVCMAGLLLGDYNILILDEPGNHLDVDTVEALAVALEEYKGTVILTSHDRHFTRRVATSIIEVRDGNVQNYGTDYDAYVWSVNNQIEAGERERSQGMAKAPANKAPAASQRLSNKDERAVRKEVSKLEKKIARLDTEKKELNEKMLNTTDAAEAMKIHTELKSITTDLTEAEELWLELQEKLA
ncbi:MAG: ABC-F family ATP-binding cassette domain-containing protein [Planctomycetaceae bacterium]